MTHGQVVDCRLTLGHVGLGHRRHETADSISRVPASVLMRPTTGSAVSQKLMSGERGDTSSCYLFENAMKILPLPHRRSSESA